MLTNTRKPGLAGPRLRSSLSWKACLPLPPSPAQRTPPFYRSPGCSVAPLLDVESSLERSGVRLAVTVVLE